MGRSDATATPVPAVIAITQKNGLHLTYIKIFYTKWLNKTYLKIKQNKLNEFS